MVDAWNADFASPENCFADFNCLHTQSYGNDGFHQLHRNEQFNFHASENHRTTAHHIRSQSGENEREFRDLFAFVKVFTKCNLR